MWLVKHVTFLFRRNASLFLESDWHVIAVPLCLCKNLWLFRLISKGTNTLSKNYSEDGKIQHLLFFSPVANFLGIKHLFGRELLKCTSETEQKNQTNIFCCPVKHSAAQVVALYIRQKKSSSNSYIKIHNDSSRTPHECKCKANKNTP